MRKIFSRLLIPLFLICGLSTGVLASQDANNFDITAGAANTGITFRAAINSSLQALASLSSGPSAPGVTFPYQLWADTSSGYLWMRSGDNATWIQLLQLSSGTVVSVPVQASIKSVHVQTFTSSGTYTPTPGMLFDLIIIKGAGGGGGFGYSDGNNFIIGGGGSEGGRATGLFTASQIGSSETITIGAAGPGSTAFSSNGGDGGTTSLGSLMSCTGGLGGGSGTDRGQGGTCTGGTDTVQGMRGDSLALYSSLLGIYPLGGRGAGPGAGVGASLYIPAGNAAANTGSGGGGGTTAGGHNPGGNGAGGQVIITEYCTQ